MRALLFVFWQCLKELFFRDLLMFIKKKIHKLMYVCMLTAVLMLIAVTHVDSYALMLTCVLILTIVPSCWQLMTIYKSTPVPLILILYSHIDNQYGCTDRWTHRAYSYGPSITNYGRQKWNATIEKINNYISLYWITS